MRSCIRSLVLAVIIFLVPVITAEAADEASGKKVFSRCSSCHNLTDKKLIGPGLQGLFGRKAGSVEGYNYSDDFKALGEKGLIWNDETFLAFIQDPHSYVATTLNKEKIKTRKPKSKLDKDKAEDLLLYLKKATSGS
ncbi:MAG: c-type cytochrome [Methyloligellaceae bacterium]